jgi:hypothetical protein
MSRQRSSRLLALGLLALVCLLGPTEVAAWQFAPLTIATPSLPNAQAGIPYMFTLQAKGGVNPYTWQLGQGSALPPGLRLHQHSGSIGGTPTKAGEYHFTLVLSDVNAPPARVQREFTVTVLAGLTIEWKRPPKVSGAQIAGSLIVANHTGQAADLTVIVVAINEIERATALGYQHFTIQPTTQQEIPFGTAPGPGSYQVRADAVAELADDRTILRAAKETGEGELVIQPPD